MSVALGQENLVHGHQQTAAAKPLNQGIRQLAPKTPGNKYPKTPLKIPLNDENEFGGLGGGKLGQRTNGKGNANTTVGAKKMTLADKNAFVTPMGSRNRAPLGFKTTNAKTKIFQTPGEPAANNELDKPGQSSLSARKPKPKVLQAEMTKVKVLGDKDELEEPEIEYMPSRAKDLPDYPDDIHELDLSVFANGGLTRGCWEYYLHRPSEVDGLSRVEREEKERLEAQELEHKKFDAKLLRDVESVSFPCFHEPECQGRECVAATEDRKAAEEKYQKTMALLELNFESKTASQNAPPLKGPSTINSKTAAAALSQPNKPTVTAPIKAGKPVPGTTTSKPLSLAPRSRKPTPVPNNSTAMRHTSATVASKTTIGHAAGRATSASLRKSVYPPTNTKIKTPLGAKNVNTEIPDPNIAPAVYIQRYGVPRIGSDMWLRCKAAGCFDEDHGDESQLDGRVGIEEFFREEAEREFLFVV